MKVSSAEISKNDGVTIEFELKNTGKRAGAEVTQLYVQALKPSVERPVKELKAFAKVELKAGESKIVTLRLKSNDFAYWDVKSHARKVDAGIYHLLPGSASNNIIQTSKININ